MAKFGWIAGIVVVIVAVAALAMGETPPKGYSKNYKVTVVVETPEGVKTGSTVRQISNGVPLVRFPDTGTPAGVRGEAVVVDLGERGVLFALVSDKSDNEFYNAFPVPGYRIGIAGASEEGIAYYATLKPGAKGTVDPRSWPGYPNLVTFKDPGDPKSVVLVQKWQLCLAGISEEAKEKCREHGGAYLAEDRFEELFGEGVKLKEITYEITDEPVTWGRVDEYLPKNFEEIVVKNWRSLSKAERQKLVDIVTFKQGEPK